MSQLHVSLLGWDVLRVLLPLLFFRCDLIIHQLVSVAEVKEVPTGSVFKYTDVYPPSPLNAQRKMQGQCTFVFW